MTSLKNASRHIQLEQVGCWYLRNDGLIFLATLALRS